MREMLGQSGPLCAGGNDATHFAQSLTYSLVCCQTAFAPTAMREMLESEGPYVLEVMVPHIEHVLPMIPGGATFKDIITEGDGSVEY